MDMYSIQFVIFIGALVLLIITTIHYGAGSAIYTVPLAVAVYFILVASSNIENKQSEMLEAFAKEHNRSMGWQ